MPTECLKKARKVCTESLSVVLLAGGVFNNILGGAVALLTQVQTRKSNFISFIFDQVAEINDPVSDQTKYAPKKQATMWPHTDINRSCGHGPL